jgi:hypothetical protein
MCNFRCGLFVQKPSSIRVYDTGGGEDRVGSATWLIIKENQVGEIGDSPAVAIHGLHNRPRASLETGVSGCSWLSE